MSLDLHKIRQWGGNLLLFLFILVLMLDPTSTILHLKDKVFIVVVAYNIVFFRPSFRFFPHIMLVFAALTCSLVSGMLQGNGIIMDEALADYKAFSPLILLLWVHHYDFIRVSLAPAIITALVVITIYGLSTYDGRIEGAIYMYMKEHDETAMMSHRYLLGIKIFAIYYKSFVTLTFPMFFYYYKIYNHPKHWYLTIIPVAIFTFAFFLSGTRATMMLPFFMLVLVGYKSIGKLRRWKYAFYPMLVLFAIVFVIMIIVLASEKGEASNIIKYAHLTSYMQLFEQHPIYLLFGQGIGTEFYTIGFHRFVNITEWTYLELIRDYGLFSIMILFTLFYPFFQMWQHRDNSFCFGMMGAYVAYILIAGTNPLLVSSTGMIVILSIYSYICNSDKYETLS